MTTPDAANETLQDRIARLERGQRRFSAVVFMLLLTVVALLAWQLYPGTRPVEGERFVLRDKRGVRRADLTVSAQGDPMLRLNDVKGKARAALMVRSDGAVSLRLSDRDGETRVNLSVRAEGDPELALMNRDGRSAIKLAVTDDGLGTIAVRDSALHTIWSSPSH